jgi:RNA polymerase sigma factor (sigma-70 family)
MSLYQDVTGLDPQNYNIHADILDRCISGDHKAYEEIYKLYSRSMYNVALRLVKDRDEAEDVLQDSFISAFSHLNSFQGNASFGAWLKRIVINKSINYLKKKRTEPLSEEVDMEDQESDFSVYELDQLSVQRIKKALLELPEGYRTVLSLYLLEGYDHQEIAEILDISVGTSKSQFNRAKKRLKESLNALMYEQ